MASLDFTFSNTSLEPWSNAAYFNGDTLKAFDAPNMELVLTSPTSLSFSSGPFSGSLTGTFQFNTGGDLVGGSISTFTMRWGQTSPFTFNSFTFRELNLPIIDFTTTLLAQGAQVVYQQALAGDDQIYNQMWTSPSIVIEGFGGNDTIRSGGGHDTIYGGDGNDYIVNPHNGTAYGATQSYMRGDDGKDTIIGGFGFDDINGNKGDDVCSGGDGGDWVVGGQGNDILYGDHDKSRDLVAVSEKAHDIVYGNLGNDTCYGGEDNDWVRGGQGDDRLYGDKGADWLSGDRGSDTLTGGAGADVFYGFSGIGLDYVTDFSRDLGDRIQLAPGTTYTLRQNGADAVVDLGNGDQIVLAGVQTSSLSGQWLFFA